MVCIVLEDTERITIVNNSANRVTDVRIFDVGDYNVINKIEKGEMHTVWINMTHNGRIRMLYKSNGEDHAKSLEGYTGPKMGGNRLTRHIISTIEEVK